MRLLLALSVLLSPGPLWAQPVAACASFPFAVEKNGVRTQFDVADLRRDRPELYRILRQRVVQDLYFGPEQSVLVERVARAYREMPRRGAWPKDQDQQKRLIAFYVHGVLGPDSLFEKLKFECGSFVDAVAAELSLVLSREEGERLLGMVTDPLHEKFLTFMLRSKPTHKLPAEIASNIDTRLLRAFNESLVESCKTYGVAAATCGEFQVRSLPNR